MRLRRALLLSGLLLCAPGCALLKSLLGSVEKPTLTFKSASLSELSLEGLTLSLSFELHNPNPFGIRLSRVRYDLQVEGHPVLSGSPPGGLQMKAQGSTDLVFPAHVRFQDITPTLSAFLEKDVARYRVSGEVGVETLVGEIVLPLEKDGSFEVPKAPRLSVGKPRLVEIGLGGAKLALPLSVANHNSFALPFGGLSAALSANGSQVADIQLGPQSSIAPGETRPVEVMVTLGLLGASGSLVNALRAGAVELSLVGSLQAGGVKLPFTLKPQ